MSDLISRQVAISAMYERWSRTENFNGCGADIGEECEEVLKAMPSADRPTVEWIPCSEERPEFPCLACDKFEQIFIPVGIVTVGKLYYDGLQFNGNVEEFLKGEKTGYGARVLPRKIVAWMPLPEPWKGADDEHVITTDRQP